MIIPTFKEWAQSNHDLLVVEQRVLADIQHTMDVLEKPLNDAERQHLVEWLQTRMNKAMIMVAPSDFDY
jgi:hypothetical protein